MSQGFLQNASWRTSRPKWLVAIHNSKGHAGSLSSWKPEQPRDPDEPARRERDVINSPPACSDPFPLDISRRKWHAFSSGGWNKRATRLYLCHLEAGAGGSWQEPRVSRVTWFTRWRGTREKRRWGDAFRRLPARGYVPPAYIQRFKPNSTTKCNDFQEMYVGTKCWHCFFVRWSILEVFGVPGCSRPVSL